MLSKLNISCRDVFCYLFTLVHYNTIELPYAHFNEVRTGKFLSDQLGKEEYFLLNTDYEFEDAIVRSEGL